MAKMSKPSHFLIVSVVREFVLIARVTCCPKYAITASEMAIPSVNRSRLINPAINEIGNTVARIKK